MKRLSGRLGPWIAAWFLLMGVMASTALMAVEPAGAQDDPVTYYEQDYVFSMESVQGNYDGETYADDSSIVCTDATCPGEDPFVDKDTGVTLYPIDSTFGFVTTDFVGADDRVQDGLYEEGWIGELTDETTGEVIGVLVSNQETDEFKSGGIKGTWCVGLGGISVKCSTENLVVMEHILTCDQSVEYTYYADDDDVGVKPLPDPAAAAYCKTLDLTDGFVVDGSGPMSLADAVDQLLPNESSVIDDIAVGDQFSVTMKDDGKLLYRWGTVVKRPIDVRMYADIALPAEWTAPGAPEFEVSRAELVIRHTVTNNPNDQLRPEDYENEAAIGLKPDFAMVGDDHVSDRDCYEGDGDFIPLGTTYYDASAVSEFVPGYSNAWLTTIDRDPFEWSYVDPVSGELVGYHDPQPDLAETLVSGPRWRLTAPKFGQDIPGLEIPAETCTPPPYQSGMQKYNVGEDIVTTLNLLDWAGESPLSTSAGWILPGFDPDDPTAPRCEPDASGDCISVNGLPLTPSFDLAVYVKGDRKPATIYGVTLILEYADMPGGE